MAKTPDTDPDEETAPAKEPKHPRASRFAWDEGDVEVLKSSPAQPKKSDEEESEE
jgi:hypothetical protein